MTIYFSIFFISIFFISIFFISIIIFLVLFICIRKTKNINMTSNSNYGGVKDLLEEITIEYKPKYEFVSLGDHCILALYMKKYNFRHQSFPFDWIVSNVPMINHILKTDFKYLIEEPQFYYKYMPELPHNDIFKHHKIDNEKTKSYMERCVNRLKTIKTENIIVFISITDNKKFNHKNYTEKDFLDIIENFPMKIKKMVIISFGTIKNIFNNKMIDFYLFPSNIVKNAIINTKYESMLQNIFLKYTI